MEAQGFCFDPCVCGGRGARCKGCPDAMVWFLVAVLPAATAFYLPGVAPLEYSEGALVELRVNKLTSSKTQVPFEYYTLPYCKPDHVEHKVENLGEVLKGDMIESSPYEIYMQTSFECKVLCTVQLNDELENKFRSMIDDEYVVNMIVDNLPAAVAYTTTIADGPVVQLAGFPVGRVESGEYIVYNHLVMKLLYHGQEDEYSGYRIVGFEITPVSTRHKLTRCNEENFHLTAKGEEISFSYSVSWEYSEVRWASRWDTYLKIQSVHIHWFSILNSVLIVVLLSGVLATILLRTVHRDIMKYNELVTEEEAAEETGWKLVHADVFRRPERSTLLSVSAGCGAQILFMSLITLSFAVFGVLSPAYRGGLLQSVTMLFAFMGGAAGYIAAVCRRFFKPEDPEDTVFLTCLTALLYPGIVFAVFFIINLLLWHEGSSGAVPFITLLSILVLWCGISSPLCYLGVLLGNKREPIEVPVLTNKIPRRVPDASWTDNVALLSLVGGVMPFSAAFTELFFIMNSMWHHQFYYLFGFLALVLFVNLVTTAEVSMTLTYYRLTSENYHWWWLAFFSGASSGLHLFLYSIFYFIYRLEINMFVSTVLYFGYMFILSLSFALMSGSVAVTSSFFFVRSMYGSIKVD